MDKEKFVVALGHCDSRFGTFTVGFDKIPLSNIRLEHLLLLPIRTIMGYLHHHGVGYRSIPWGFKTKQTNRKEDDVLTGLQTMPVVTASPFVQLAEFLSEQLRYHLYAVPAPGGIIIDPPRRGGFRATPFPIRGEPTAW
jgi:hypothetical protein